MFRVNWELKLLKKILGCLFLSLAVMLLVSIVASLLELLLVRFNF